MQAAIASSSISPYMWIVSGPRSIVPLCGEGIEASKVTGQGILPDALASCDLEEDPQGDVGGAAPLDQVGRAMEIDVVPDGDLGGCRRSVARPFECLGPPGLDQLGLLVRICFRSGHHSLSNLVFGREGRADVPYPGESSAADQAGEANCLVPGDVPLEPERPVAGGPDQDIACEPGVQV